MCTVLSLDFQKKRPAIRSDTNFLVKVKTQKGINDRLDLRVFYVFWVLLQLVINCPNLSNDKYRPPCKLKIYLDCSSQLDDVLGCWIVCSYRSRTLVPAGNHCQCHNLLVQLRIDYWRCSKSSLCCPACYSLL